MTNRAEQVNLIKLLKLAQELGYSREMRKSMESSFNFLSSYYIEEVCNKAIPLVSKSKSEEDALNIVDELIHQARKENFPYRYFLADIIAQNGYSLEAEREIEIEIISAGGLSRERINKKAIPLVQNSKTEDEAVKAVKNLVKQEKEISKGQRHYAFELLRILKDLKYSIDTHKEIIHWLVKILRSEPRDEIAKKAIPLVQNSQSEKEAIEIVKQLVREAKTGESHYSSTLLEILTEMEFSEDAREDIISAFYFLNEELTEQAAKQAIPLVQNSKTELEAVRAITRIVKQMEAKTVVVE